MDNFYEQMIKKKKTVLDMVIIAGGTVLAIAITAAIILLFLMCRTIFGLNFLLIFCMWWGYIWLLRGFDIEYEYTITNHELDIDVIKGKNRRKHITTINLKQCEYFGNRNDPQTIDAMKASGRPAKEYYFVGNKASENIFVTDVISKKDSSKIRVYIEPDEKLLQYIRLANPKAYKGERKELI